MFGAAGKRLRTRFHLIGSFSGAGGQFILAVQKLDPAYRGKFADPAAFANAFIYSGWVWERQNRSDSSRG